MADGNTPRCAGQVVRPPPLPTSFIDVLRPLSIHTSPLYTERVDRRRDKSIKSTTSPSRPLRVKMDSHVGLNDPVTQVVVAQLGCEVRGPDIAQAHVRFARLYGADHFFEISIGKPRCIRGCATIS